MRRTKFRGLNRNSNTWYYGSLLVTRQLGIDHAQIWLLNEDYPVPVDIETTGEWIGHFDKNGKEVYEGDIIKAELRGAFLMHGQTNPQIEVVGYEENMQLSPFHALMGYDGELWMEVFVDGFEVIGNVYENPDLLTK